MTHNLSQSAINCLITYRFSRYRKKVISKSDKVTHFGRRVDCVKIIYVNFWSRQRSIALSDICVNFWIHQFSIASTDICVIRHLSQFLFAPIFDCVKGQLRHPTFASTVICVIGCQGSNVTTFYQEGVKVVTKLTQMSVDAIENWRN